MVWFAIPMVGILLNLEQSCFLRDLWGLHEGEGARPQHSVVKHASAIGCRPRLRGKVTGELNVG